MELHLVRLSKEHEVLQEGQRVTLPAGSLVEVSEHTLRTFADRMELVERISSTEAADDNADGQQTEANGPQLVQDDDGEAGEEQDQQDATEPQEGEGAGGSSSESSGASPEGNPEPTEAQPTETHQPPAYNIVQKPGGWYGIMVNGEEVGKGRKEEIKTKLIELGLVVEE